MGFFNNFPYTNFHELNIDWVLKEFEKLRTYVNQYTAINKVGYAGVWSITNQYPQWSVVTNGDNSYLSNKPVPVGINIDNEEYWTHLADLDPRIGAIIAQIGELTAQIGELTAQTGELTAQIDKRIMFIDDTTKFGEVVNNNCIVVTSGYYEKMDGGGAVYIVKTKVEEQPDNITIFQLDNNRCAILFPTSNALAFGISTKINNRDRLSTAILHCSENGGVLNFPDGNFNIGDGTYDIDTSKISIGGTGNTRLISSGASGYVFTLKSPLDLDMYDLPRKPLHDLAIIGDYFADNYLVMDTGAVQYGVSGNADATLVSPHIIVENVVIRGFNVGFNLGCAYKSSLHNCSVIACDLGVYVPSAGKAQAVPVNFVNFYAECCNYAIRALGEGYNTLNFYGGAFEYNRSVCTSISRLQFVNTRFEFDARASCSPTLDYRNIFNITTSPQGFIKFTACNFLALPGFVDNVKHWIKNPYIIEGNITSSIFFGNSKMFFSDCDFGFDASQVPNGAYIVSGVGVVARGNMPIGSASKSNIFNPAQIIADSNGVLDS